MPTRLSAFILGLGIGSLIPHLVTLTTAYFLGRSYIDDTQQR